MADSFMESLNEIDKILEEANTQTCICGCGSKDNCRYCRQMFCICDVPGWRWGSDGRRIPGADKSDE